MNRLLGILALTGGAVVVVLWVTSLESGDEQPRFNNSFGEESEPADANLLVSDEPEEVAPTPLLLPTVAPKSGWEDFNSASRRVLDTALPSMVAVDVVRNVRQLNQSYPDWLWKSLLSGVEPIERQQGLGAFVSDKGHLIVSAQLVFGASSLSITSSDGRTFVPKVIGVDYPSNLALLQIDIEESKPIMRAGVGSVRSGDAVFHVARFHSPPVAIRPVTLLGRDTFQIFKGLEQEVELFEIETTSMGLFQGGFIFDVKGQLLGMVSCAHMHTGSNASLLLALPVDFAAFVEKELKDKGQVVRGYLGAEVQRLTKEMASSFQVKTDDGVLVSDITDASPASSAGMFRGDIITAMDGRPIVSSRQVKRLVSRYPAGSKIKIKYLRDGRTDQTTATLDKLTDPFIQRALRPLVDIKEEEPTYIGGLFDGLTFVENSIDEELPGIVIGEVKPDSLVALSGLTAGDRIVEVNRQPLSSVQGFEELKKEFDSARHVILYIQGESGNRYLTLKLPE